MSPRLKHLSDFEVVRAATHVVAKKPGDWTLRDVGDFVGLSAGTLIQRFGSKTNLSILILRYINQTRRFPVILSRGNPDSHTRGLFAFCLIASVSSNAKLSALGMKQ